MYMYMHAYIHIYNYMFVSKFNAHLCIIIIMQFSATNGVLLCSYSMLMIMNYKLSTKDAAYI